MEKSSSPTPSALFVCPYCGHETMRFAVVRSASFTATEEAGVTICVENDEKPWLETASCASCGVSIDVPVAVEAALENFYRANNHPNGL